MRVAGAEIRRRGSWDLLCPEATGYDLLILQRSQRPNDYSWPSAVRRMDRSSRLSSGGQSLGYDAKKYLDPAYSLVAVTDLVLDLRAVIRRGGDSERCFRAKDQMKD
jgi:hypothetical protein